MTSQCNSKDVIHNSLPWPEEATEGQRGRVQREAQAVLDVRALFPNIPLTDLYDPVAMPPPLAKAHGELDRVVDRLYRAEAFGSDLERVELLFEEFGRLAASYQVSDRVPS